MESCPPLRANGLLDLPPTDLPGDRFHHRYPLDHLRSQATHGYSRKCGAASARSFSDLGCSSVSTPSISAAVSASSARALMYSVMRRLEYGDVLSHFNVLTFDHPSLLPLTKRVAESDGEQACVD